METYAEAFDLVKRQRKVDLVVLVWTLILGFPADATRTLPSLKLRFEQVSNIESWRVAFHARLGLSAAPVCRADQHLRLSPRAASPITSIRRKSSPEPATRGPFCVIE